MNPLALFSPVASMAALRGLSGVKYSPYTVGRALGDDTLPDCPSGMLRDPITGACLPDGSDPTKCAPGLTYDPAQGICVFGGDPAVVPMPGDGTCPAGYGPDAVTGMFCVKGGTGPAPTTGGTAPLPPPPVSSCPSGFYKDWAGNCLPQKAPPIGPQGKDTSSPPAPRPNLFSSPLFWAGAALLVVGGVVIAKRR